jgi:hypothetical protein
LWRTWVAPLLPLPNVAVSIRQYVRFVRSWRQYTRLGDAEKLHLKYGYPCLFDAIQSTPFDAHYFYQALWATQRIAQSRAPFHVDVGSEVRFVSLLTTHKPTIFLDYRPLKAKVAGLNCLAGDILQLPFQTASVSSLSCLHVVEHIGLGRYGDPLNPLGTRQACTELARVLTQGGNLFFSTPIGQAITHFNAHRIHTPRQIVSFFPSLELVEFSVIDDQQQMHIHVNPDLYEQSHYACGLFWFRRTSPEMP